MTRHAPADGFCLIHGRYLTYAEFEQGVCGWCAKAIVDEAARISWPFDGMAGPAASRLNLLCLHCKTAPIPADRTYYCSAECNAKDLP
jgi:hypothetical protein